jgi:hypothetical protein
MNPTEIERCRHLYADLMLEIKERVLSVGRVAEGKTTLEGPLAREFCFLQLRMACECIALACLSAHIDMTDVQTPKFQKTSPYEAKTLLAALENLHPNFYPKPIEIALLPDGGSHVTEKNTDHLTKADLLKLIGLCGDQLHRDALKKYQFKPNLEKIQSDFVQIIKWANKIFRLMEAHKITLASGNEYLLVSLFYGENHDVVVAFAGSNIQYETSDQAQQNGDQTPSGGSNGQ